MYSLPRRPEDSSSYKLEDEIGRREEEEDSRRPERRSGHHSSHSSSSHHHSSHSNGHHHSSHHPSSNRDSNEHDYSNGSINSSSSTPKIDFEKYDEIPVEVSGSNCPSPIESWKDANLSSTIVLNLSKSGYSRPTPVQKYSLPIVMRGRDLMGCAQTGSGKTAAFLLPIISQILLLPPQPLSRKFSPIGLVLAPTRELAVQIYEEARKFSFKTPVRPAVVYGGAPAYQQLREMERGCEILVATPGRLVDILDRGKVSLSQVKFLVLDEADRMLDMGFEPQIRQIIEKHDMPPRGERQTLMFSATFAKDIQRLASTFLHDYVFLTVGRIGSTTDLVTQTFIRVYNELEKEENLLRILERPKGLTLIFVETKRKARYLETFLRKKGFPATSIHGDRVQTERTAALKSFSSGQTPFLIATNVAARGLDISNIAQVINFDMPSNIDDYVHRIGRTGRIGKMGVSTAFFSDDNVSLAPPLLEILKEAGQEIPTWLMEMTSISNRFKSKGKSGKFGGRDVRYDYQSPSFTSFSSDPYTDNTKIGEKRRRVNVSDFDDYKKRRNESEEMYFPPTTSNSHESNGFPKLPPPPITAPPPPTYGPPGYFSTFRPPPPPQSVPHYPGGYYSVPPPTNYSFPPPTAPRNH